MDAIQQVPGLPGLAVLAAGAVPPNPQELLGRPSFGQLLALVANQLADAEIVAARTGAAIMVSRVNRSSVTQTTLLARRLQEGGVSLVGSVLSEF